MATVGNGEYTYEPVENWAKLPPGWSFKEIGSVGVDRNDNVYVFNRGEHPMMVFDRDGNFLRSWGEGIVPARAWRVHGTGRHDLADRRRRPHRPPVHAGRQGAADAGHSGQAGAVYERRAVPSLHPHRDVAAGRYLRVRRLWQFTRAQILAGGKVVAVVGRAGHRSGRVQHRAQHHLRRAMAGCMWPIARTTACRCSTATGVTRRSGTICIVRAGCSCRRANVRSAISANWARCSR